MKYVLIWDHDSLECVLEDDQNIAEKLLEFEVSIFLNKIPLFPQKQDVGGSD